MPNFCIVIYVLNYCCVNNFSPVGLNHCIVSMFFVLCSVHSSDDKVFTSADTFCNTVGTCLLDYANFTIYTKLWTSITTLPTLTIVPLSNLTFFLRVKLVLKKCLASQTGLCCWYYWQLEQCQQCPAVSSGRTDSCSDSFCSFGRKPEDKDS